jgi:toxin ParE1/3/4
MMYKVIVLASAERDLRHLKTYILKNFSTSAWQGTYGKLKQAMRGLEMFPLAGAIPAEIAALGSDKFRQIISGKNRIIYQVKQDTVYIHMIADVRRDLRTLGKKWLSTDGTK